MTKLITKNGNITTDLSVDFLQHCSDRVRQEWDDKQARLTRQRDENRKYYFPKLWTEEQAAKQAK